MLQRVLDARDEARARLGQRESGFTLIELLIVIVILGVLAAVVVLAVGAFNDRGEEAACRSDVKAVEVAVEAYRAKESRYPDSLDDLVDPSENYLRSLPNQDPGTGEYHISYEPSTGVVTGTLHDGGGTCGGASPTGGPTAPGGGEPGEEAPGQVTGLSVGSITQTSASVSWSAPATGGAPTGYTIQWATNPGFTGASQATDNASPFALSGLTAGTTYHVRVAATNGEGTGDWASTSFTTSAQQVAPSTPTNVNVQSNCPQGSGSSRTCNASWNASTGNPTPTYEWQRVRRDGGSCSSSDFNQGGVVGNTTSSTSVQLTGLTNNQNYCFRVRATNSAGTSNWEYDEFQP